MIEQLRNKRDFCFEIHSDTNSAETERIVQHFFAEQCLQWTLLKKNVAGLKSIKNRRFNFQSCFIDIQVNPERKRSTCANPEKNQDKKCVLCLENLIEQQKALLVLHKYLILCNPFPIFYHHLTISSLVHEAQKIENRFDDLFALSEILPSCLIFYNGAKCGASVPEHFHFQAGKKESFPLMQQIIRNSELFLTTVKKTKELEIAKSKNYPMPFFCLKSANKSVLEKALKTLIGFAEIKQGEAEPMMNLMGFFDGLAWNIFVFFRAKLRPWQFSAENEQKLLISPASVELLGLFVTPEISHFLKITKHDILDICKQITISENKFAYLEHKIKESSFH
ncbi:MAG: hypothetical protein CSA05_03425 [Bacteroidia bacterium]|nr:MAG: hypothetical protein CSB01_00040 [Bacteroidia bacterium]PIE85874.1 MAG: hypothetical protein CSA05_03425 [Bacteroidia bacterium]